MENIFSYRPFSVSFGGKPRLWFYHFLKIFHTNLLNLHPFKFRIHFGGLIYVIFYL